MAVPPPRVTVIVATYNRSVVLRSALESIRRQTWQDFDVWVVGDACTDDTEAVVAAFGDPRFQWTNLPVRAGSQFEPNNEGLRRARASLIAYLGHDDLWLPWHLESLIEAIDRDGAGFACSGVVYIGPDGPRELYGEAKTRAQVSVAPPSGWLHRREVVERCGPWRDPAVEPIGTDVGFQARAFRAGIRFTRTGRVSVLKFPSSWWRAYASDAALPQDEYLTRLIADPVRLEADILTALAFDLTRRYDTPSVRSGMRSAFRGLQRRAGEWYGVDRWPLAQYLRWRSGRRRSRARVTRGL